MSETYLAIDLGAESGRGVLGHFDGERIRLEEIHRFVTGRGSGDLCPDGVQRWNFDGIMSEIDHALATATARSGGRLAGVGVDSWGVDYGLLDVSGALLAPPVCYRDRSHIEARSAILEQTTPEAIWDATGIQGLSFNTLYQLAALQKRDPALLEQANRMLLVPDLIHHHLTGGVSGGIETSNGSTTQMMRPGAREWNADLLTELGLPTHILPPLTTAGSRIGTTASGIPVYTPATHDTASAVLAAPASSASDWAFLSSGTWSLLGAELTEPVMSHAAMRAGFSNEGGPGESVHFLKNIIGLWLVQQTRRGLQASEQRDYSYADLAQMAERAAPGPLVDAIDERFLNPADMVLEIRSACRDTGQDAPDSVGEIVRCCLESLALAYRRSLQDMSALLGRKFEALHIVGGGSDNGLLNQWTADAIGIPVLAGPGEATALGNILGQLMGAGAIGSWQEARELSRRSFIPVVYTPDPSGAQRWTEREAMAVAHWGKRKPI